MRKILLGPILLIFGLGFWLGVDTVVGETNQFIITNADESNTLTVSESATLNTLIAGVAPRFVIQHANEDRFLDILQFPVDLSSKIDNLLPRYIIQHANENRFIRLHFPLELIGDSDPPIITDQPSVVIGQNSVTITWTTNEFTTSLLEYGETSGTYTDSVVDDLYKKTHQISIVNLIPGVTLYYKITSTDLSLNTAVSQEFSVTLTQSNSVYLPLLNR